VKSTAPALLVVCVLLSLPAAASAAGSSFTDDVPVRGGIAALADVIPISPAPDRARFLSEAIRVVYSWPQGGPYSNEPMRRRIADFLAGAKSRSADDDIPVPLTADLWSRAVFHRTVSRDDLAGAILADRTAALLAYALAGVDDETLQFFADHPALLSRIAERAPAVFGAFGESIRVHNGHVIAPGGETAAAAWESVVGEKLERPDRFLQQLLELDRGRLAYLLDVLSHVDAPMLSAAIGAGSNADGLKHLAALARRAFPEWEVASAPFVRPAGDLAAFFGRIHSATNGERGAPVPGTTSFWQQVFDESVSQGNTGVDIPWLAEAIAGHPARERERRLDLFGFTVRVLTPAAGDDDAIAAAHGFGSFSGLMLALERIGIRTPSVYVAAARQAEALTSLDATRGTIALGQFQGAVALIARLAAVRTIDTATAERLARELFALRLASSESYNGAIGAWLVDRVIAVLPSPQAGATVDDVILAGVAGPARTAAAARMEWEGQRYLVDPGGAELARLRRARERQEGVTFATALGVTALVRRLNAATPTIDTVRGAVTTLDAAATELAAAERPADDPAIRSLRDASRTLAALTRPADLADARRVATPLAVIADTLVGHALLSLAYACDLGDPDGTILIAGDPSRRHDFGYDVPGRDARLKAMWGLASIETRRGPWHLVGSAFDLDLAMAPLALRRISVDRVPASPMLNLMQRDGFAATVAAMNGAALTDADRDRIADYIGKGRRRVAQLTGGEPVEAIARAIDLDGWRARALVWTIAHDAPNAASLFSLGELLVLGGGSPATFNSWGTYAFRTAGCLCSRLPTPGEWRHWWGLSQAGLPAILVADLPLNVAVVLHNLNVPAVLAKAVLAAAMQDFVDATNPTDGNDWLTLARAAQAVDRARFEDYIAAATADGPLVAESADGDK
jgi:hypothetical protein